MSTKLSKIFAKLAKKPHVFVFLTAILIGILTRFVFLTSYTQFDGEQARSGFILMDMWQGKIPTLGAPSSVGGFAILPYYYYWTFLWTIFGTNPIWQVMSNAFPSFLLIPLIFVTIYKLLHSKFISLEEIWQDFWKNTNSKLLIAVFGSLFYSIFFTEIFYSQMEWNPNAGTFWLILIFLSLEKLWNLEILQTKSEINLKEKLKENLRERSENKSEITQHKTESELNFVEILEKKNWNKNQNGQNDNQNFTKKIFILSILVGILVNLLLSLHSSFLFTTPVFCLIFGTFWLLNKKNKLILSFNFASIWFFSLPYWVGEFGRNFENTINLFKTLIKSNSGQNWVQKFDRLLFSGLEIGKLAYFPDNNLYLFSHIFLTILLILTILFYAQIKSILLNLLVTFWLIFVLISANFGGILHTHYLVIIWVFPCLLTAILFHFFLKNQRNKYLDNFNKPIFDKKSLNFIIIFLLFGTILSFGANISKVYVYTTIKFGQKRLTNTQDIISIMNSLPQESQICLINPERKNSLDYLNQFVIRKNQKISICDQNSLENLQKNEENRQNIRQNEQNLEIKNSNLVQTEKQSSNNSNNSKNLTSTNLQNLKSAKIFVFWENYSGMEMTLKTKPLWLESWQIRQKIGNIEILETN